jgi:diphthamide biosynthesis enzyme Dph1/Dph2-like protein
MNDATISSSLFMFEADDHAHLVLFLQIWRLKQAHVKTVALQLPEGLQLFACTLADIIGAYANVEVCHQSCGTCDCSYYGDRW